jgi:predicted DNA-binding protein
MYGGMYVHCIERLPAPRLEAADMARKKISTTIYITAEQNERLKLLHDRTKVPVAVYIREGIDLVLERHQAELPGQLQLAAAANDSKK